MTIERAEALAGIDASLSAIGKLARSKRAAGLRQQRSGVRLPDTAIVALAAVYRLGPLRMGEVAAAMDLDPSRASREVRRLVDDGLVVHEIDPDERRASLLTVTAKGRRAFERYRTAADDLLARTFVGWTDQDLAAAADLLARLSDTFLGARAGAAALHNTSTLGGT